MLNKKAIETLSVNAVKDSIVTSDFLDQFINENDKEPSWDGFVYIYSNKTKKKSDLKGRMAVQIKGKLCDDHTKKTISFPMSTVDLRNYLYDRGCILFVVYIGKDGSTNKIYYIALTPIKLRDLLKKAKSQKYKTVQLDEFPADNNKKATIFLSCLQNCQKQASFIDGKLFNLEELEKQEILENIVIPVSGVGITDPQTALLQNEVYLYAKVKGSSILQPIETIPRDIHTQHTIEAPITIDDKVFYKNYRVVKSSNDVTIYFGKSIKMKFTENNPRCQFTYKNSKKIRVLAKDLDFMLTYLDKGYFRVKDVEFPFDNSKMDAEQFDVERERTHLAFAQSIVKVLDLLGCSDDIDINDMDNEDWRNINRLITAFLEKKSVKGLKKDLPPVVCLKVGKLKFMVYLKQCEEKGTYKIYDFFKTDFHVALEDEHKKGEMLPISQFCILHEKDLLSLSNIDFDILLPSFQNAKHHHETFNRANLFLLELLNAYDKATGTRQEKLLNVCKDFSSWISEAPDEELDYQIKTLNILQTIKRYRDLNIDEIKTLYLMVENTDTREDCVVGAYLLLEQQQAAEIHFSNLSEEEQKYFKTYPIYHFWKSEETQNGQA